MHKNTHIITPTPPSDFLAIYLKPTHFLAQTMGDNNIHKRTKKTSCCQTTTTNAITEIAPHISNANFCFIGILLAHKSRMWCWWWWWWLVWLADKCARKWCELMRPMRIVIMNTRTHERKTHPIALRRWKSAKRKVWKVAAEPQQQQQQQRAKIAKAAAAASYQHNILCFLSS